MRAELLPVTVAIRKKNGTGILCGSLTPTWTGTSWNGHCALVLPDSELFVDPTIEQFDEVRKIGMGPMVGTLAALRAKGVRDRAMQSPHQRLRALLQAVGDAPYESDEAQDVRFHLPGQRGQERWLRLDEIPLPSGTPAAWPR